MRSRDAQYRKWNYNSNKLNERIINKENETKNAQNEIKLRKYGSYDDMDVRFY